MDVFLPYKVIRNSDITEANKHSFCLRQKTKCKLQNANPDKQDNAS